MEDLLAALSPEEVSHLVDEMAADPDDKHMPASARSVLSEFSKVNKSLLNVQLHVETEHTSKITINHLCVVSIPELPIAVRRRRLES